MMPTAADIRAYIDHQLAHLPAARATAARLPSRRRTYAEGVNDGIQQALADIRRFVSTAIEDAYVGGES